MTEILVGLERGVEWGVIMSFCLISLSTQWAGINHNLITLCWLLRAVYRKKTVDVCTTFISGPFAKFLKIREIQNGHHGC